MNVEKVERQGKLLVELDRERRKLLQAYYDDALPADLLKEGLSNTKLFVEFNSMQWVVYRPAFGLTK